MGAAIGERHRRLVVAMVRVRSVLAGADMKIQRPQATVGWIPSRRRYALFRLAAYLRLLRTPPERRILDETKVLAIDRDQSTAETYSVAALVWLTFSCFIAE